VIQTVVLHQVIYSNSSMYLCDIFVTGSNS